VKIAQFYLFEALGKNDQLGALGLLVNMIVLWNTIYIGAALSSC
jgi:TnpA family transposase